MKAMKSSLSKKEHKRSNAGGGGGGAAGSSLFRRRNHKGMDFLSDFKNDLDTTKDIFQLIREQMLTDPQSVWKGFELLYLVVVNKRRKTSAAPQSAMKSSETASSSFSAKQERYLVLLKKPETSTGLHLVRVTKKENELEFKSSFDLSQVKSLDYGSDDSELLVCEEAVDHSVFFNSTGERDETLWILIQVCRMVTGAEVSIGYSVDVDGLEYLIANSGIFARFPQLQKVISLNSSHLHDQFTTDETEAEHILDEINWSSSLGGQKDLREILAQRSDKLNHEIIDFLLQWEELDEAAAEESQIAQTPMKATTSAAAKASPPSSSSRASSSMMSLRDTREVLTALSLVDEELRAVETWLGNQIKKLSSVRGDLSLIEEESGSLETSWQNLNVVEQVVSLLVEKYSFEGFEEDLLRSPDTVISSALKSPSLSTLDKTLQPLINAGRKLRNALVVKPAEVNGISVADWKQVQAIAAINSRKAQLMEIADTFCAKFGEVALSLFDKLLKHRALQEGDVFVGSTSSKAGSASKQIVTIVPKSFSSKPVLEQVSFATIWIDISRYFTKETNQLMESQELYHNYLETFAPLLDLQAELASASSRALCEAYMRATHERLYAPLIKAFAKDLQTQITYKQPLISFQSVARYRIGAKNELSVNFHQANNRAGQAKLFTSWKTLEVALMMIAPAMAAEEHFIKRLFHLDGRKVDVVEAVTQGVSLTIDEATFLQSRLYIMLETIFESAVDRLLSLSSSQTAALSGNADLHDGVESVAMLATVTQYADSFREILQNMESEDSHINAIIAGNMYLSKFFKVIQSQLEQRITAFTHEQIQWITNQRADPKSPEVLLPFVRFPSLVMQIVQMTNGKTFDCVDELLVKVARELLSWLTAISKQNEKYVDKIKLTNLVFFHLSLSELKVPCLQQFVVYSQQQILEASVRYINWMVEYAFPALSALASRIDGVGRKVDSEDLALYIRRKDVLSVIKELDGKNLDTLISNLAKRIEKHFKSEGDADMGLLSQMWMRLKDRIVDIVTKLEVAASNSYQIDLDVKPAQLSELFDKFAASF